MIKEKKVLVLYRVIQQWRAPIFEKLNNDPNISVSVWHGPDYPGTKLISTKDAQKFNLKKLPSFRLNLKSSNGQILMPISPLLFFQLIIENPDVIISEGASNLFNSIQGFIYAKLFNKKFIWWSLGKLKNRKYDNKRSKIDYLIQFIERHSDSIISYSSRGLEYFESIGVKSEKIFVAVNVVDTDRILRFLDSNDLSNNYDKYHNDYDFVVLFVGALTKEKDIAKLLYAQKIIEDSALNIGLLIVGDGTYSNDLKNLSKQLELDNVEFLGNRVNDSYIFFSSSDIFVLPGLGGLAVSEAMCYGLPVICSIGDGSEVDLVTVKNGIIDEELNPNSLAEYIIKFYNNKEMSKSFGLESKKLILRNYNTDNYIKNIKNAILS
ncbi:glycosyltransferase family 4 protein [Lutimonas vermicola]|uniref:Glycosyltransferase family 4 protein n=1 Tax=Lutimonas vermicola TaxID=414288 RepID=A0ABU9KXU7_9FLAO